MADEQEEIQVISSHDGGFVSFVAEEMAAYHRQQAEEQHEVMPSGLSLSAALDFYRTQIYNQWDPMRLGLTLGDKDSIERARKVDALGTEMNAYIHATTLVEQAVQGAISELFWLRDRSENLEEAGAFDAAIDIIVNRLGGERRSG